MKWLYCFAISSLLTACISTIKLEDQYTRVPKHKKAYRNSIHFDSILLQLIDTNVLYVEYDPLNGVFVRESARKTGNYEVLRFYANGCFNKFQVGANDKISPSYFNPLYQGYRGVFYKGKEGIRFDLFQPGWNEMGFTEKLSGEIYTNGDTLFLSEKKARFRTMYVKQQVADSLLYFKGRW